MKKPAIRGKAIVRDIDDSTEPESSNSSVRWIILIPFIIVLGVLAAVVRQDESAAHKNDNSKAGKQTAVTGDASAKKMIRKNINLYVFAGSNEYDRKGLGGISNLEISVNNASDYIIDKVRVKIMYIKANGGIHEVKYEDFLSIKPNSKATHKIPDSKRGTSVKYEIASIKSKALGLG